MKKLFITILVFFLIADVNFSSENILKNLIKQGIQETYSLNIDKAEEIFNKAINQYPSNPQGYLYLSQIYLWSYLGSKEEADLKLFNTYNNLAVERIDSLLQENSKNVNTIYLNGLAYQLKAMAYTTQGSSLDAFWAAKKSVSNYEKTLEIDSTFYDSYLGLGLFDYALSFVPSFFKWALTISGLSYDKDRALKYLTIAYNKSSKSKSESAFHLSKIYLEYLADYKKASSYLDFLIEKYPNNSLFLYQNAVLHINSKQFDKAKKSLEKVIKIDNKYFKQTTAFSYFLLGEIAFRKNDFETALRNYEEFIRLTKIIDYTGLANYRMAVCYAVQNKSEFAAKSLQLAKLGNPDISDDSFAKSRAEAYYNRILDDKFLQVQQIENLAYTKKYNEVISMSSKIDSLSQDDSSRVIISLIEANLNLKNWDKFLEYSEKIENLKPKYEKWVDPFHYYFLAEYYFIKKDFENVKKFLAKARDYDDYIFKNELVAKLNNIERRLKKQK